MIVPPFAFARRVAGDVLQKYKFGSQELTDIEQQYSEKHRFYHTFEHVLKFIESGVELNLPEEEFDMLVLVALYHDIVYSPLNTGDLNERVSAEVFKARAYQNTSLSEEQIELVYNTILSTVPMAILHTGLDQAAHHCDTYIFRASEEDFLEYDHQIFKEYQFYNYTEYLFGRKMILEIYLAQHPNKEELIEKCLNRPIKIGLFLGTFNPFHTGHKDVLDQAEKDFDKVIIGFGHNPDKPKREVIIPDYLKHHQTIEYTDTVPELLERLGYDVTIIRGIRNSEDEVNEKKNLEILQGMLGDKPLPPVRFYYASEENKNVSSTAIRNGTITGKSIS